MSMSRTLLKAGGSLNVSWHLGYSHRGGYRLELVSKAQVGAGRAGGLGLNCAGPSHHTVTSLCSVQGLAITLVITL